MILLRQELHVMNFAITLKIGVDGKLEPRTFSLGEHAIVLPIASKINALKLQNTQGGEYDFDESEIELSTEEKSLILRYIREMKYNVEDLKFAASLEDKLK